MEIDLRALQLMVESEHSVEATRDLLTEAVEYFSSLPNNKEYVKLIFQTFRDGYSYSNIEDTGIYFHDGDRLTINEIPKKYKSYSLGLFYDSGYPIYEGRIVYPVRDVKGKVMGVCGWYSEGQPKYLDSVTYGYNAKRNSMYGMEKLRDYYLSSEAVFIVEGIPCCNYLRDNGFQSLALLGSSISSYVIEILKRFENRCIIIPDNDEAGLHLVNIAKKKLPKCRCYVSTIAKDIDDSRRVDNGRYVKDMNIELKNILNPFNSNNIFRLVK